MIRTQHQLPNLEWYKQQQRRGNYWTARFHGYVCVVRAVSGRAVTYRSEILYLDKSGKILSINSPKNIANEKQAIEWCATTLSRKKYLPKHQRLRWQELERGQSWKAYEHGYVCYINKYSREGYTGYWPSIFYLHTSSDKYLQDTSRPYNTPEAAQFWCADYLIGHGVYREPPKILVQRIPWNWIAAAVVFIIFLLLVIASNSH